MYNKYNSNCCTSCMISTTVIAIATCIISTTVIGIVTCIISTTVITGLLHV